ncbi:hypothetical protein B0H11DRAFT_2226462 [Mycena galericulata]|nr:hypothetical protein B0H11DRAFT_2226462 [Mycena galericulata]
MNEALRMEWAKTRARFMRQREQLELLEEEMRRILEFLRWKANWWRGMAGVRPPAPSDEAARDGATAYAPTHKAYGEGNLAYARRQAARLVKLANRFEKEWEDVADFISMARTALGVVEEDDVFLPSPGEEEEEEEEAEDERPVPPRPLPPDLPRTDNTSGQ